MNTPADSKPGFLDIVFYFVVMLVCFFSFNHSDLIHTGGSSFTYLNGHIGDFYDANEKVFGGTNYLPSSYIIYAIWNLPLKLLGIVKEGKGINDAGYIIFWYKLLTTLFFAGAAYFLYKIGSTIGLNKKNAKLLTIVWVSSPILFFSQFIFGQTDIFCLFFVMIGLFYYLRRNIILFVLFFGISFTFKYFPIYIFIPLLLLAEKKSLRLINLLAMAFIPVIGETLFYVHSPAFIIGVGGFNALSYLYILQMNLNAAMGCYPFMTLWFILCGICYYLDILEDKFAFYQVSFYVCLVAICSSFILVFWHPQWLLFMTPFLAVTTFMNKKIKAFLFLDFIMMIAFVGATVIFFKSNVDEQLFHYGLLAKYNLQLFDPGHPLRMADIFVLGNNNESTHRLHIYFSLFVAMLMANMLLKFPHKNNAWEGDKGIQPVQEYWNTLRLRFFGGMAVFVIPAFIVYFSAFSFHPQGIASSSSEFDPFCTAGFAFENNPNRYWQSASTGAPFFLEYNFYVKKVIKKYALVARSVNPMWYPVSWVLEGSNDEAHWDVLDRQVNQKFDLGEKKDFILNNHVSYKYYKVGISKTNGDSYCVIARLLLKE